MKDYKDEEKLRELYQKYNTQKDVAEACGCSSGTISIWMDKFGIDATDTHSNVRERDFTPIEHDPNISCDWCGNEFWRKPSLTDGKNFCDDNCHGEWLSENVSGSDHHQYNQITVECASCGDTKEVPPSHHKQVENHFCSGKCRSDYGYMTGEDNHRWKGGKVTVECANCSTEKEVYPYNLDDHDNFFCDGDCRGEWVTEEFSGENHPLYEGYSENYGTNWLSVREKVRGRDDGKCQICGKYKEELGGWPDTHHIKPKNEFDTPEESNTLDNLILLCSKCHSDVERDNIELPENHGAT